MRLSDNAERWHDALTPVSDWRRDNLHGSAARTVLLMNLEIAELLVAARGVSRPASLGIRRAEAAL